MVLYRYFLYWLEKNTQGLQQNNVVSFAQLPLNLLPMARVTPLEQKLVSWHVTSKSLEQNTVVLRQNHLVLVSWLVSRLPLRDHTQVLNSYNEKKIVTFSPYWRGHSVKYWWVCLSHFTVGTNCRKPLNGFCSNFVWLLATSEGDHIAHNLGLLHIIWVHGI